MVEHEDGAVPSSATTYNIWCLVALWAILDHALLWTIKLLIIYVCGYLKINLGGGGVSGQMLMEQTEEKFQPANISCELFYIGSSFFLVLVLDIFQNHMNKHHK